MSAVPKKPIADARGFEFATTDPTSDLDDLRPLLDMIGDARIVGLGECSHGSREVNTMRHRIVSLLATEVGFTTFALEETMPCAARLNEYVLDGRGDPTDLLGQRLYWGVRTREMLDLVRWMRAFNASGRGPIDFTGIDAQRHETAVEDVLAFLERVDPGRAPSVRERYARVDEALRHHHAGARGLQTWLPPEMVRGRRVRFSGHIRTRDASEYAAIYWWSGNEEGTLAHEALEDSRPSGTTDWREYVVEVEVPTNALYVSFGALLVGNGAAWFEGLRIEIDGERWEDPDRLDLDLRTEDLHGWFVDDRTRFEHDAPRTPGGLPSLRLQPVEPIPECETTIEDSVEIAVEILAEIEDLRRASPWPEDHGEWAVQCARVVLQILGPPSGGGDPARSRAMAENALWLLDRRPGGKVILWAHNGHIERGSGDTGAHLARALGTDYRPVGFTTGEGEYSAWHTRQEKGTGGHALAPPPDGSFERLLTETGHERLILDLRAVRDGDPDWGWLAGRRPFRSVGGSALSYQFHEQRIRDDFDLLVWLRETSAAVVLPCADGAWSRPEN